MGAPSDAQSRLLVVDDDEDFCRLAQVELKGRGFQVDTCLAGDAALAAMGSKPFDLVITDLKMAQLDGLALCKRIVQNFPGVPVVVLTGQATIQSAIGAIQAGAYDFALKPADFDALALSVRRAVEHQRLKDEARRLRTALQTAGRFEQLLGRSPVMEKLFDLLHRIAEGEASVLVVGESGTGKELVARALHEAGPRKAQPFVALNCAAVPEHLLESELFGHVRGAFTDAKTASDGVFRRADRGTLFLDEIGDMQLSLQAKLLRVLQERRVRPVGGDREFPVDLRVISATNKDLKTEVAEGRFREDLFFRLDVIEVKVPPLRARGSDVLLLAQEFLTRFATRGNRGVHAIGPDAASLLLRYGWPGNVRELMNCIERAVTLAQHDTLVPEDLPERIVRSREQVLTLPADSPSDLIPMSQVESRYISHVLTAVGGNKTLAAQVLGFDRSTLYRKIAQYELG